MDGCDHFRTEIDPDFKRGFQVCKQISTPKTKLKNARTLGDEAAEEFRQTAVISFSSRPALSIAGDVGPLLHPSAGVKFLFYLGHILSSPVASSPFTLG
jgi:hypothetical protein